MDCNEVKSLLSAYVDGEMDARSAVHMEEHLRSCSACSAALESVKGIRQVVARNAQRYSAPASLRSEIQKSVASPAHRPVLTLSTAAAMAACVLIGVAIGMLYGTNRKPDVVAAELLKSHVRALMSDHLADVVSTDKHTVKPWFNGRIDYSPPVNDFAVQGFPLKGGRLEYLQGNRVAVLVYGRAKHVIDLYVEPSSRDANLTEQTRDGFNELHWADRGFDFWAVSDLNSSELRHFAGLVTSGGS